MAGAGFPEVTATGIIRETRLVLDRYNIVNEDDIKRANGQMRVFISRPESLAVTMGPMAKVSSSLEGL